MFSLNQSEPADDAGSRTEITKLGMQVTREGYRRVDAELRHRGIVVNAKKIRRLMREHALKSRASR
jgi:putative transposase